MSWNAEVGRHRMKTRAAVAFEAKKPLEIVELDLEGPKAGEVLVEIMATGICLQKNKLSSTLNK